MTTTAPSDVGALRARMSGGVRVPGDPGYEEARRVWNGDIDRRPAVIASCASPADVVTALAFARAGGLEVAVRGGGHGYWGAAVPERGLMIDLSPMREVTVDPEQRLARCGGGALLADLDGATQAHGLAVPAGTVSHTGVGGLTLGGGFGWLTPLHGLSIDNLESAEVVLADGRIVRASAAEYPDLFWALRGGGGNFGVVTEFEFRLHPVGPMVQMAMLFVEQERAGAAIRAGRDDLAGLPRTLSGGMACICAPPAPFVPEEHHFRRGVGVLLVGFGDPAEHAAAVADLSAGLDPLFEASFPIPYTALQQMLDENAPTGILSYTKGLYLDDLPDEAADVLAERLPLLVSPTSQVLIFGFGGAYAEVPDEATAFGGRRDLGQFVSLEAVASDPEAFDQDRQWVRTTWDALRPAAIGPGTYVNLMAEVDETVLRSTYGPKYDRLARIKAEYDPDNVFRATANIKPV